MNNLILLQTRRFNDVDVDFYKDGEEFVFTREQVGMALDYADPRKAIAKIHERNKQRLDKFSVVVKMTATDGKAYDTYVYSWRGLYEITMMSKQPVAQDFRDWVYEVLEEIRKTGRFEIQNSQPHDLLDFIIMEADLIKYQAQVTKALREQVQIQKDKLEQHDMELLDVKDRINTLDNLDIIPSKRQRFLAKITQVCRVWGLSYTDAYHRWKYHFNIAFGTNIRLRITNYNKKHGTKIKSIDYLEIHGLLDDAIRVADKLIALGRQKKSRYVQGQLQLIPVAN